MIWNTTNCPMLYYYRLHRHVLQSSSSSSLISNTHSDDIKTDIVQSRNLDTSSPLRLSYQYMLEQIEQGCGGQWVSATQENVSPGKVVLQVDMLNLHSSNIFLLKYTVMHLYCKSIDLGCLITNS